MSANLLAVQTLTMREEVFVRKIFEGISLVNSYRATFAVGGLSDRQISLKGDSVLRRPHVQRRLAEFREAAAKAAGITQAMVLNELVNIAFADPSCIVETRVYCCRYCYGFENKYQWTNKREFDEAYRNYEYALMLWNNIKAKGVEPNTIQPEEVTDEGGYEFNKNLPPNSNCPNCDGAGGRTVDRIKDTRFLTPEQRRLIANIKNTKNGVTVELRDRSVPLKMIAEHLGMFVKKVQVQNPDGTALGAGQLATARLDNMPKDELSTLKTLLLKALAPNDNSVSDAEPREVVQSVDPHSVPIEMPQEQAPDSKDDVQN